MLSSFREILDRQLTERVNGQVDHMHELISAVEKSTHKLAKQRDANDHLSHTLHRIAEAERICMTLKEGIISLARSLTLIEDHRQALIDRTESKILPDLCSMGQSLVANKQSIRKMLGVKSNIDDSSRRVHAMQVDRMEEERICDLKRLLSQFVTIHLNFHCKSIELLTATRHSLNNVQEYNDLAEFRRIYKINMILPANSPPTTHENFISSNSTSATTTKNNTALKVLPLRTSKSESTLAVGQFHHSVSTNSLGSSKTKHREADDSLESLITKDVDEDDKSNQIKT